jgi:hypothetical protein
MQDNGPVSQSLWRAAVPADGYMNQVWNSSGHSGNWVGLARSGMGWAGKSGQRTSGGGDAKRLQMRSFSPADHDPMAFPIRWLWLLVVLVV